MISVEFRSAGPGKCRWCKKEKDVVISLAFSDGSFVGNYCLADFKKALLDKLESSTTPAKTSGTPMLDRSENAPVVTPAKPNGSPALAAK
jgi:hypothetical protein